MIILEQLIFNILAFTLFVIIFLKIVTRNDTSYVMALLIEALGIAINFMEIITNQRLPIFLKVIVYVLAILLPILIIALEKSGTLFLEALSLLKAKLLLLIGNSKAAKKVLISLVTKYPDSYLGHKKLAEVYEKEGGMRKAIDEYVKVIDINKQDYNSYYKVADLLNNLDKKDEAVQMLNNLLHKKPEHIEASKLLGDILIEQEKYKEAAYVYNDALKYFPTDYDLNYNLGIVYTMLNDFQNAKMYYEKAATLNSLEYNSKYSLAEIALIYKELEEAEQYFMQTLQDPKLEADSYFELARISLIKGEKEKAIQYANIALESDPRKIAEKIKNDETFIMIMPKLTIPLNLENIEEKESKLSSKDRKAKEHLEKSSEIARSIGYDDVKMAEYKKSKAEINTGIANSKAEPEETKETLKMEILEPEEKNDETIQTKENLFKKFLKQDIQKEKED